MRNPQLNPNLFQTAENAIFDNNRKPENALCLMSLNCNVMHGVDSGPFAKMQSFAPSQLFECYQKSFYRLAPEAFVSHDKYTVESGG